MQITVGESAVSGISLDLPIDPEIPRDPDFTKWAVALQQFTDSGPALVVTSLRAQHIRQETDYLIRTTVPSSGMYCPAATLPDGSTRVARSGCDELASVQAAIADANVAGWSAPTPPPTVGDTTSAPEPEEGGKDTTPTPGVRMATKIVTTMALAISEEALGQMMANPTEAVAGLAKGFADYLGIPAEQVTVTKTVPDLFGGAVGARMLSESGTRLEVEYEVLQAPGEDVTTTLQALADGPPPASLVQNLESALAEGGMVIEVEVLEVAPPEVIGQVPMDPVATTTEEPPTPAPPSSTPASEGDSKAEEEDAAAEEEASGGGGMTFLLAGVVVGLVVVVGGGAAYASQAGLIGGQPQKPPGQTAQPENTATEEVDLTGELQPTSPVVPESPSGDVVMV